MPVSLTLPPLLPSLSYSPAWDQHHSHSPLHSTPTTLAPIHPGPAAGLVCCHQLWQYMQYMADLCTVHASPEVILQQRNSIPLWQTPCVPAVSCVLGSVAMATTF